MATVRCISTILPTQPDITQCRNTDQQMIKRRQAAAVADFLCRRHSPLFLRRVFASSFISLFLRLSHFRSGLTARRGAAPLQLYHTCLMGLPARAQRPQTGSRHPLFTAIWVPFDRPWPRGGKHKLGDRLVAAVYLLTAEFLMFHKA